MRSVIRSTLPLRKSQIEKEIGVCLQRPSLLPDLDLLSSSVQIFSTSHWPRTRALPLTTGPLLALAWLSLPRCSLSSFFCLIFPRKYLLTDLMYSLSGQSGPRRIWVGYAGSSFLPWEMLQHCQHPPLIPFFLITLFCLVSPLMLVPSTMFYHLYSLVLLSHSSSTFSLSFPDISTEF